LWSYCVERCKSWTTTVLHSLTSTTYQRYPHGNIGKRLKQPNNIHAYTHTRKRRRSVYVDVCCELSIDMTSNSCCTARKCCQDMASLILMTLVTEVEADKRESFQAPSTMMLIRLLPLRIDMHVQGHPIFPRAYSNASSSSWSWCCC
jgi:hypothetical protein